MKNTLLILLLSALGSLAHADNRPATADDLATIERLQRSLQQRNFAGAGHPYARAKAGAWLDFALDEYYELDRTGIAQDATDEAAVILAQLDAQPGFDASATPHLAHVAFAEAILGPKDLLGERPAAIDYSRVPWAIYCNPEVAFAGHSEASAKEAGFDVLVSKHRFAGNSRAMILGETDGLVKIIAEKQADGTGGRVLGVHMVGPWVTEQLSGGYLAVNWEATVDEIAEFIQPHPSLTELFGESVLAMTGRSLHG